MKNLVLLRKFENSKRKFVVAAITMLDKPEWELTLSDYAYETYDEDKIIPDQFSLYGNSKAAVCMNVFWHIYYQLEKIS